MRKLRSSEIMNKKLSSSKFEIPVVLLYLSNLPGHVIGDNKEIQDDINTILQEVTSGAILQFSNSKLNKKVFHNQHSRSFLCISDKRSTRTDETEFDLNKIDYCINLEKTKQLAHELCEKVLFVHRSKLTKSQKILIINQINIMKDFSDDSIDKVTENIDKDVIQLDKKLNGLDQDVKRILVYTKDTVEELNKKLEILKPEKAAAAVIATTTTKDTVEELNKKLEILKPKKAADSVIDTTTTYNVDATGAAGNSATQIQEIKTVRNTPSSPDGPPPFESDRNIVCSRPKCAIS